jgi:PAS domain S-box-containing protein
MIARDPTPDELKAQLAEARQRLADAEETLRAIHEGDVDALVVDTADGPQLYTLASAQSASYRFQYHALSSVNDAIVALDTDDRITFFNAAAERMYGVLSAGALGRKQTEIYDCIWETPDDEPASIAALVRDGFWRGENVHRTREGREIRVESSVAVLRDDAGEPTGQLAVIRDVTVRHEAEQALRQADRKKDDFIATLAHELRNPLAPIRNAVSLLRMKEGLDPHLEYCRSLIDRQVERMAHLLDDMLDVSRITRGKITLRQEALYLAEVIDQAIELARPLIDSAGHELVVELPNVPVMLYGDPVRFAQIFSNLLTNAAKYTETRGRIELTAVIESDGVRVAVRDNGIGIAADYLPNVFDMFGQVKAAIDRSQGGLGIGLSLVKGLVEMHGGRISATSEGLGKGSEFAVWLPALINPSLELAIPMPESLPARSISACRILVVDDNQDGAESLAFLLRQKQNEVEVALNGYDALERVKSFRPDAVLLDIGLPGMNGYEVCRTIRERSTNGHTVIIATSGWGQEEDRRRTREAGFDAHLVKPVQEQELMALLAGFLPEKSAGEASQWDKLKRVAVSKR